jgi:hypothetical protein
MPAPIYCETKAAPAVETREFNAPEKHLNRKNLPWNSYSQLVIENKPKRIQDTIHDVNQLCNHRASS